MNTKEIRDRLLELTKFNGGHEESDGIRELARLNLELLAIINSIGAEVSNIQNPLD